MYKTFKLLDKKEEQLSETEGKMIFELEDENGAQRSIWGITELDEDLNAIAITAIRNREHPLIHCLFLTNVGEKINIDFTQYNELFERKEEHKVTSAEDIKRIAKEMQSKPMRMGSLLKSTEINIKTTESMD